MAKCERCGDDFWPRMSGQRFCCKVCGDAWFAEERRAAVQAFRQAQQRGFTYHDLAQIDDGQPGGRYALLPSRRIVTGGPPSPPLPTAAWSRDPVPDEPLIEGDGDVLGVALGGEGGRDDV
jgi:hypothetical protein